MFKGLRERWRTQGVLGAARDGVKWLDEEGANALIFDSPRYGVTVTIARGGAADDLRAAFEERQMLYGGIVPEAPEHAPGDGTD